MRIALVTDLLDKAEKASGVPLYTRQIATQLKQKLRKDELYFLHFEKTDDYIYEDVNEILVRPDPNKNNFEKSVSLACGINNIVDSYNIDIVHVPNTALYTWLPLYIQTSVDSVFTVHSTNPSFKDMSVRKNKRIRVPNTYKDVHRQVSYIARKLVYNVIDEPNNYWIPVSRHVQDFLCNQKSMPRKNTKVIYQGVSKVFRNNTIGRKNSNYILAHPPRIKLLEIYEHALNSGVEIDLIIFGSLEGYDLTAMKKEIQHRGLSEKVKLVGYVSQNRLATLYANARMFVSYSTAEAFGLTPLEAMSCGCPVIASKTGGLQEVVGGGGIVVDNRNVKKWAKSICKIAKNKKYNDKIRKRCLNKSHKYSWDGIGKRTIEFYKDIK